MSPSTLAKDLGSKRDMYGRQGVKHLWTIEPEARVLEVFELTAERRWILIGNWIEDAEVDPPPFIGTRFKLSEWWLKKPAP